ncbi:OmpP1/FadL family transporter [Agarilytica rhodophyticola]|uniref:OmpP1/FadL family transporter n=1 Tax=Agarilytica rhodophyticola TaxID=1737490 RepID=UPI000B341C91|nr:outer membrane protein transport protein [Agarilytica rhodophyticola]
MKIKRYLHYTITPSLLISLGLPVDLIAHEYEEYARSATGTGRAYSGEVSKAEDATSVYANPAALSKIEGNQRSGVFHALTFNADFEAQSQTEFNGNTVAVDGDRNGDMGGLFGGPNLYWMSKDINNWKYGFSLNTPYGYGTDYPRDWVGRYHGTFSQLFVFTFSSSASYRVNDNLSIGLSLPVSYSLVDFDRSLNQIGRCIDMNITCNIPIPTESLSNENDGKETVSVDGFGVGFTFGLHYKLPTTQTSIGLVYRAEETHELSGNADYERIRPEISDQGIWQNTGVDMDLILPASISLGFAQPINEKFLFMTEFAWKEWSKFKGWQFDYDNNRQSSHRIATDWGDSVRSSVSLDYIYDDKLTLRMGYAYDNSPVRGPESQSPFVPGSDIEWFTLGASWKRKNGSSIDVAYAYLDYQQASVTANSTQAQTAENIILNAQYELDLHFITLQYNF